MQLLIFDNFKTSSVVDVVVVVVVVVVVTVPYLLLFTAAVVVAVVVVIVCYCHPCLPVSSICHSSLPSFVFIIVVC